MEKLLRIDLQLFNAIVPDATNAHATTNPAPGFGQLLEPGLRKIFFETYDELKEQFPSVYNMNTSKKAKETDWGMGAFGDWTPRASEYDTVDYKLLSPGLERTYTHSAFTQGFMVTREMYDDDQYRQFEKMPRAMARSGRAKVEKDASSLLINGFTAGGNAIYNGKALFAADHPLLDSPKTMSNLATGSLDGDNLKRAIALMREGVDEAGNLIQLKPTKLIIPPALEDTAIRVTKSDRVAGTDLNDTNRYLNGYGLEIVVLDYLSDAAGGSDTAWYLQDGGRHELNFFWRIRPEFKWEEDFDSFVAKYRGYMRYSYGVSDFRGIVGSTGIDTP